MKKLVMLGIMTAFLLSFSANSVDAAGKKNVQPTKKPVKTKNIKVLLTNDDGCKSPGIVRLKKVLEDNGYDVWMSAPAENQSGIGTAITFKPGKKIKIEKVDDKTYCFPGTPSDSVDFALNGFMRNNLPDIVISGVNNGQNTGIAQLNSGTVGAAIRALRFNVPAMAVSLAFYTDGKKDDKERIDIYWLDSISYAVRVLNDLVENRTDATKPLLPSKTALSINYPALPKEDIKGVQYKETDFLPAPQFFYEIESDGITTFQVFNEEILVKSTDDNDTGWLDQGYIVYTILDGDWNAIQHEDDYKKLLKNVNIK